MFRNVKMSGEMFHKFTMFLDVSFKEMKELHPIDLNQVLSLEVNSDDESIKSYAIIPIQMKNNTVIVGFEESYVLLLWNDKEKSHKEPLSNLMWVNLTVMGFEHIYDEYANFTTRLYGTAIEVFGGKCVYQHIIDEKSTIQK